MFCSQFGKNMAPMARTANVVYMPCRIILRITIFRHFPITLNSIKRFYFLNYCHSSEFVILHTFLFIIILKTKENKNNLNDIFSKIKESSSSWVLNFGNEYRNLFIFIALLITGD